MDDGFSDDPAQLRQELCHLFKDRALLHQRDKLVEDIKDQAQFGQNGDRLFTMSGSVAKFGAEVVNCLCRLERGMGG